MQIVQYFSKHPEGQTCFKFFTVNFFCLNRVLSKIIVPQINSTFPSFVKKKKKITTSVREAPKNQLFHFTTSRRSFHVGNSLFEIDGLKNTSTDAPVIVRVMAGSTHIMMYSVRLTRFLQIDGNNRGGYVKKKKKQRPVRTGTNSSL